MVEKKNGLRLVLVCDDWQSYDKPVISTSTKGDVNPRPVFGKWRAPMIYQYKKMRKKKNTKK